MFMQAVIELLSAKQSIKTRLRQKPTDVGSITEQLVADVSSKVTRFKKEFGLVQLLLFR